MKINENMKASDSCKIQVISSLFPKIEPRYRNRHGLFSAAGFLFSFSNAATPVDMEKIQLLKLGTTGYSSKPMSCVMKTLNSDLQKITVIALNNFESKFF